MPKQLCLNKWEFHQFRANWIPACPLANNEWTRPALLVCMGEASSKDGLSIPYLLTRFSTFCRFTATTATRRAFESSVKSSVFSSPASCSPGRFLSPYLCPWKIWKTPRPDPSPSHWARNRPRSSAANSTLLTAGCSSARYHSSPVSSSIETDTFFMCEVGLCLWQAIFLLRLSLLFAPYASNYCLSGTVLGGQQRSLFVQTPKK